MLVLGSFHGNCRRCSGWTSDHLEVSLKHLVSFSGGLMECARQTLKWTTLVWSLKLSKFVYGRNVNNFDCTRFYEILACGKSSTSGFNKLALKACFQQAIIDSMFVLLWPRKSTIAGISQTIVMFCWQEKGKTIFNCPSTMILEVWLMLISWSNKPWGQQQSVSGPWNWQATVQEVCHL